MVEGGDMKWYSYYESYYDYLSINTVGTYLLLVHTNDLEFAASDIWYSHIHGWTKDKIYIVEGSEFGE